jgi:hypothetical protein
MSYNKINDLSYYDIVNKYLDMSNFSYDNKQEIYKLFKGIIHYRNCPKELLIKCCENARLQELITKKLKRDVSDVKNWFINSKINLDNLLVNKNIKNNDFIIYDDNYCPNCNSDGYITEENCLNIDCPCCYVHYCRKCVVDETQNELFYKINKLEDGSICKKCYNIIKKINANQQYDLKRFNIKGDNDIDNILNILYEQNNKCYDCNDELLTIFYEPYCCYQFSIDRINNSKPHNKNNVRITCYYCNCKHHEEFKQHNKKCNQGCHDEKLFATKIKAFKFNELIPDGLNEVNLL